MDKNEEKKTLKELLNLQIPENISINDLREALIQINRHESNKNVPIEDAKKYIKSIGIPPGTPEKYLGIILLNWIEKLTIEHEREAGLSSTTGGDLEQGIQDSERIREKNKEIRENARKIIDQAIKRKEEIQEEIKKAREAESKLKGKNLYASVTIKQTDNLDEEEKEKLTQLQQRTIDKDKRSEEINRLSKEFEKQLKIEDPEERSLVARAAIVGIISQAHSLNPEHQINSKILDGVSKSLSLQNIINEDDLLSLTRTGSIALALNEKSQTEVSRQASYYLFGGNITNLLFNPEIEVNVTETKQSNSNFEINLQTLNGNHRLLLQREVDALDQISNSENPISTIYSRIFINTREEESKINTGQTKKIGEVEKIAEIIRKTTPQRRDVLFDLEVDTSNRWVQDVFPQSKNIQSLAEKSTGPTLVSTAVSVIAQQIGTKTVGTVATKGLLSKILPKLFGAGGPLAWLGAETISWISQWLIKNQDKVPYILAAITGAAVLPFFGLGTALAVGGISFVLVAGVGATSMIATSMIAGLNLFWRLIVLPPLKGFLFGFLAMAVATTFILFIINSGAYIVPQSPPLSSKLGADNPYMLVTKIANSPKLDNSDSNQTVIYVVTVKALKGNLTNVNISGSECKVIKKDKSAVTCPTEVFPEITNEPISPNEPHSFSFTGIYDSKYSDSLIYDSITFTATAEDGTEVTTSGSASVCIGDCPKGCLKIDNSWVGQQKVNIEDAITKIVSGYPGYIEKVCSTYDQDTGVILKYDSGGNGDYWGQNYGSYIKFYPKGVSTKNEALYTLAHELGHSLQNRFKGMEPAYQNWPGIKTEKPHCFYSATVNWNPDESLSEALGLFIAREDAVDHGCNPNFESKYPIHTEFLKTKIFD